LFTIAGISRRIFCSSKELVYGTVKDVDCERLERTIQADDKIWTELGLSKTPKYHTWMHASCRAAGQNGLGATIRLHVGGYGSSTGEKSKSQDGDKFARRVACLPLLELRARSYRIHTRRKTFTVANDPQVVAAQQEAMEKQKTGRKRKATESSLATQRKTRRPSNQY
jgi:hypothetical protein